MVKYYRRREIVEELMKILKNMVKDVKFKSDAPIEVFYDDPKIDQGNFILLQDTDTVFQRTCLGAQLGNSHETSFLISINLNTADRITEKRDMLEFLFLKTFNEWQSTNLRNLVNDFEVEECRFLSNSEYYEGFKTIIFKTKSTYFIDSIEFN